MDSVDEFKREKGYIALLDILGFSDGLIKDDLQHFFKDYYKLVNGILEDDYFNGLKYYVFSDTIIIFTTSSSLKAFKQISQSCSLLFQELMKNQLPIRGAISHGKFNIQNTKNGRLITGTPIIEAVKHEKWQNWTGIMLTPSAQKQLIKSITQLKSNVDSRLMNVSFYGKIPLKKGTSSKVDYDGMVLLPLNKINPKVEDIEDCCEKFLTILDMNQMISTDPFSQDKYQNYISFLKHYLLINYQSGYEEGPYLTCHISHLKLKGRKITGIIYIQNKSIRADTIFISIANIDKDQCEYFHVLKDPDEMMNYFSDQGLYFEQVDGPLIQGIQKIGGNLEIIMLKGKKTVKMKIELTTEKMRRHVYIYKLKIVGRKVQIDNVKDYFEDYQ